MILLTDFFELPMMMSFIVPLAALALFVGFLMWESRLPVERRFLRKLRREKKEHKVIHHKTV